MSLGVPTSAATPVSRFRIVAFWEGISYLLLLFVAMPLKYGLGIDMAVRTVGMAHGLLFLGYCGTLALAAPGLGPRRSLLAFVLAFCSRRDLLAGGPVPKRIVLITSLIRP